MADGYINVGAALNVANGLVKDLKSVQARIGIVRSDLRHAVAMGQASPDETKAIAALFPPRERKSKTKA